MIRYELRPETGEAVVTFTVRADDFAGQTMAVVGDFNGWDPTAHAMDTDAASGVWTTSIPMPVGRYAFRYLTGDGTWLNDDGPHGWEDNGMGADNSVLDLGAGDDGYREEVVPGLDEPTTSMADPAGEEIPGQATAARARVKQGR